MLTITYFICISLSLFPVLVYTIEEETLLEPKLRHDYKLTFKKPYYYNNTIPFFDTYGRKLVYKLFFCRGNSNDLIFNDKLTKVIIIICIYYRHITCTRFYPIGT